VQEETVNKTFLSAALAAALLMPLAPTQAQAPDAQTEAAKVAALREKLRSDKRALVAANMKLTDVQANKFWPIYDDFQREWRALQERRARMVLEYVTTREMTELHARKLAEEALAIERDEARLHEKYFKRLVKAVPATVAARYMQIESKIEALYRYDLARTIPLVD
jgi:Spy/CpxP family protein refolding chaperone